MFVIAGATGHVGSVVASRLLAAGKRVTVLVRDREKGSQWLARGAELAVGDLNDPAFVSRALQGAQGFFTLLPPDYAAEDIFASQRAFSDSIAAGVHAVGVPHVVLLSSLGAELPSGTGPIKGLHYFEERLGETGAIVTALRAAYFQENAATAVSPAKESGIFPNFGDRDDLAWPMIAAKDIGEEAARALLNPPAASEVVDVLGPEYAALDVASALGRALGKELKIVNIPQPQWVRTLREAGVPPSAADALAELHAALTSGILQPHGDRVVRATTTIHETIGDLVKS
jgi:uncharacterized protein YbjT (DUF2867 family)